LVCIGTEKCGTQEQADQIRKLEEAKKAAEEAEKRRKEEAEKQAAADAKFKADAPERKKVSEILKEGLEKKRVEDLKKSSEVKQRELQEFMAEYGPRSANCQLVEMGWGAAEGKACALKELKITPAAVAGSLSPPRDPTWARRQLEELARGKNQVTVPVAPAGKNVTAPTNITKEQLDYLRRNIVVLQPEQRKIALAMPVPPTAPQALSTFLCGTPPNQYACPTAIEAAREKTAEVYKELGVSPQAVLDRLEERHKKGLEYLRDSPEVKDALLSIQVKAAAAQAGFQTGGGVATAKAAMNVAEGALLVQSYFEGADEFRRGKHYEGTLRVVNEVSSAFLDHHLKLPASDALNLAGAASTAYLYGFLKGF
jgi:hypothetical protein